MQLSRQTNWEKLATPKASNAAMITNPASIYATKVLGKDIEIDKNILLDTPFNTSFSEMWSHQHPLIHTWFLLSSVSICCLTAFLFIMH